jgi:hypothetical protein
MTHQGHGVIVTPPDETVLWRYLSFVRFAPPQPSRCAPPLSGSAVAACSSHSLWGPCHQTKAHVVPITDSMFSLLGFNSDGSDSTEPHMQLSTGSWRTERARRGLTPGQQ